MMLTLRAMKRAMHTGSEDLQYAVHDAICGWPVLFGLQRAQPSNEVP